MDRQAARTAVTLTASLVFAVLLGCTSEPRPRESSLAFVGCRERTVSATPDVQIFRPTECAIYVVLESGTIDRRATNGSQLRPSFEATAITDHRASYWSPRWSPGGDRIAFVSSRGDERPTIVVANPDGTDPAALDTPLTSVSHPFWSPDGSEIAFIGQTAESDTDVYVISAGGSDLRRVTSGTGFDTFGTHPLADFASDPWSPDGTRLAFTHIDVRDPPPGKWASRFDLVVVDADGGTTRRVSEASAFLGWAPDGEWLLTIRTVEGDPAIQLVSAEGPEERRLADLLPDGFVPYPWASWSPDGERIAFAAWDPESSDSVDAIYLVNTDGGDLRFVTGGYCVARQGLTWSPDGERLVFVSGCDFDPSIGVVRLDGSERVMLGAITGGELIVTAAPDWSPVP